jgi:hypothetical protein
MAPDAQATASGTEIAAHIVLIITAVAAFSGCIPRLTDITTVLAAIGVTIIKTITGKASGETGTRKEYLQRDKLYASKKD